MFDITIIKDPVKRRELARILGRGKQLDPQAPLDSLFFDYELAKWKPGKFPSLETLFFTPGEAIVKALLFQFDDPISFSYRCTRKRSRWNVVNPLRESEVFYG